MARRPHVANHVGETHEIGTHMTASNRRGIAEWTKNSYMVIFQPSARRGLVEEGTNLIEASRQLGVDIEALCGEKKVCGKCKIRIEEGSFEKFGITSNRSHASEWQEEENKFFTPAQKKEGYRLACVAKVQGDLLVFVPEEARAGKQIVSKAARDIHMIGTRP